MWTIKFNTFQCPESSILHTKRSLSVPEILDILKHMEPEFTYYIQSYNKELWTMVFYGARGG